MMLLGDWMRRAGLSDADVGRQVGVSAEMIRKVRFGVRGASVRVAARIDTLSGGQVRAAVLTPKKSRSRRPAPVPAGARP